jgi:hypothetical protein
MFHLDENSEKSISSFCRVICPLRVRSMRLLFSLPRLGCCLLIRLFLTCISPSFLQFLENFNERPRKSCRTIPSSMDPRPKFKYNPKLKLKPPPLRLPPKDPGCRSDEIHPSPGGAQPNSDIRDFYLYHVYRREGEDVNAEAFVPPPLISASPFVPSTLVRLLMRGKKDSALGIKYASGDEITNSR